MDLEDRLKRWFLALPEGDGVPIEWDDVWLCDLDEAPPDGDGDGDDALAVRLCALPYVLVHRGARALGWARGAALAGAPLADAALARTRRDAGGATPLLCTSRAEPTSDDTAHVAPPHAFFWTSAPGAVCDVRPTLPGVAGGVAALLDALLEIAEMCVLEGIEPSSREFVRRCAHMHARLFDLATAAGRRADVAALALLPYAVYAFPQLDALVHTALARLFVFRLEALFPGETRLARACAPAGVARAVYTSFEAPSYSKHVFARATPGVRAQIARELAARFACAPAQCAASLAAAERRLARSTAGAAPRRFYVVPALRDAFDVWGGAGAGDAVAFRGHVVVHYGELPLCLARRAQHHFFETLRVLRRNAPLSPQHGLCSADDAASEEPARALAERYIERIAPAGASASANANDAYRRARTVQDAESVVEAARRAFAAHLGAPRAAPHAVPRFVYDAELAPSARRALERFADIQRRAAHAHAQRRFAAAVPPRVEETPERLVAHAWAAAPPCYARVITRAFASDLGAASHPKYLQRIRLAMFWFYAGWPFERALRAWQHLFASKCRFAARSFEAFAQHSEYARTLESLHALFRADLNEAYEHGGGAIAANRDMATTAAPAAAPASGGPTSCARLCADGACPMSRVETLGAGARAQLRDEFAYVPDIEELGAPWHDAAPITTAATDVERAQTRCTRLYVASHRGRPHDTAAITHPLAFYARALSYHAAIVTASEK
jgi:hypothetical protein